MKKILLIGSYGRGNLGDDAFIYAAIKLFPNCEIYINSANDEFLPKDLRSRVKSIQTTGMGDFVTKIRTLFSVSHVVYFGGDLWVELYGDRFPRMSLYKMAILNCVLKVLGKKIAYFGCGAGKIKGYSLFLARVSACLASVIIVREQNSKDVLNLEKIQVLPDVTINLFELVDKQNFPSREIGISVMYYIPDPVTNYKKYVQDLKNLIVYLHNTYNFRIKLIPMLISDDVHDDQHVCEDILKELGDVDRVSIMEYDGIDNFLTQLSLFDIVISTRLHGSILSILSKVPAIGISYRPKVASFFKKINLPNFAVAIDEIESIKIIVGDTLLNYNDVIDRIDKARLELLTFKNEYDDAAKNFIK